MHTRLVLATVLAISGVLMVTPGAGADDAPVDVSQERQAATSGAAEPPAPDEQFMKRQARASKLLERLERMPSQAGFLGLRLNRDGTVVLKTKKNHDREALRGAAAAESIDLLRFEDVTYSLKELEALAPEVTRAAESSDFVSEGVNTSLGKIGVHGAGALDPSSALGQLQARYPDLLDVREYVIVETKRRACQAPHCDPPLRGGVRITASNYCTAGFNVLSKLDNKPYLLTAGHCIQSLGPPPGLWYTRDSLYGADYIGAAWKSQYGPYDAGIIKFDPTYYYPGHAYAGVVDWTYVANRSVTKVGYSAEGFYFCFSGGVIAQNGSPCDYVKAVGAEPLMDDGQRLYKMGVWGYRRASQNYCPRTQDGDSGGPFWDIDGFGYGILSGEQYTKDARTGAYLDCALVYQSLALALDTMNVKLRTTTGY